MDDDLVMAPPCKLCGDEMFYVWDRGTWTFHLSSGEYMCPEKKESNEVAS